MEPTTSRPSSNTRSVVTEAPPVVMAEQAVVVDRVGLRLLGLVLVAMLALLVTWSMNRIDVVVDGDTTSVSVFGGTVADALSGADVALGDADLVEPVATTPLADGMSVEVRRAGRYTVVVDGQPAVVHTVADGVDDLLVAAGIGDVRELVIAPGRSAPLVDGMVVHVTTPHRVTVEVDDQRLSAEVVPTTVASVLEDLGVEVGDDDRVDPPLEASTSPGLAIQVTRRGAATEEVEVPIEFETDWVGTDDLLVGEDEVVQDGQDGLAVETWEITLVDGEEVDRDLVDTRVQDEPVDRIVNVGTREPAPEPEPEPEPEPASSTPDPAPTTTTPDPQPTRTSTPRPDPRPEPEPAPEPERAPTNSVWDRLAQCESNGRWDLNVGLYDGGLQFHPDTWRSWKRSSHPDYAWQATRSQQIEAATRLQAALGWGQWPHCSRELGLR